MEIPRWEKTLNLVNYYKVSGLRSCLYHWRAIDHQLKIHVIFTVIYHVTHAIIPDPLKWTIFSFSSWGEKRFHFLSMSLYVDNQSVYKQDMERSLNVTYWMSIFYVLQSCISLSRAAKIKMHLLYRVVFSSLLYKICFETATLVVTLNTEKGFLQTLSSDVLQSILQS